MALTPALQVRDMNLPGTVKAVLTQLAICVNTTHGLCCPSYATLARYSGFSVRTVKSAVSTGVRLGLVTVTSGKTGLESNRYTLHLPPLRKAPKSSTIQLTAAEQLRGLEALAGEAE